MAPSTRVPPRPTPRRVLGIPSDRDDEPGATFHPRPITRLPRHRPITLPREKYIYIYIGIQDSTQNTRAADRRPPVPGFVTVAPDRDRDRDGMGSTPMEGWGRVARVHDRFMRRAGGPWLVDAAPPVGVGDAEERRVNSPHGGEWPWLWAGADGRARRDSIQTSTRWNRGTRGCRVGAGSRARSVYACWRTLAVRWCLPSVF